MTFPAPVPAAFGIAARGDFPYNGCMRSMLLLPDRQPRLRPRRLRAYEEGTSLSYAAGFAAAGFAMAILPFSYAAIGGSLLWALHSHMIANFVWVSGPQAGLFMGALYFGVSVFLAALCIFHFLPLLPSGRIFKSDLELREEDEPRLHAFVRRVSDSLRAPVPLRILASMDVNASARFAPDRNGGLELVLGLPLVRGLSLGQFAAVLAHELGHFRQGTAMRLVHSIRTLNQWFARAGDREYAWESRLSEKGYRMDPLLYGAARCASACAKASRWVLLMHAFACQAASCLLLRQMERDADMAAIRLAGGENFAEMVLEAKVIGAAWELANRSLGLSLREGRLADDLPALVAAHMRVFIPEVRRKMERSLLGEKTIPFDTHPSLAERVGLARKSGSRGVFHSAGPAHALFGDFQALSREATIDFYRRDLGDGFDPSRLIPSSDLATGQSDVQAGEAAVGGYFLGLLSNLRPLLLDAPDTAGTGETGPIIPGVFAGIKTRLAAARTSLEAAHARAAGLYREYVESDSRMLDAVQALALMRAGFWIEPGDFQLGKGGLARAGKAFTEAEADQKRIAAELSGFESAMRSRLQSALLLLSDPEVRRNLSDHNACAREAMRLLPVASVLFRIHPRLETLRRSAHGMGILLENLDSGPRAAEVRVQLETHALAIRIDLDAVRQGLKGTEYPFGFAPGASSLADYALDAMPCEGDYSAHFDAAEEALGRCCALYFRIFGRLAMTAGRVEGVLGFGPLRISS